MTSSPIRRSVSATISSARTGRLALTFTPPPRWEGGRVDVDDVGDLFGAGRGPGGFSDFFATLFGARRGPR